MPTTVPTSKDSVLGIINLRNKPIPIIDLGQKLGIRNELEVNDFSCFLVSMLYCGIILVCFVLTRSKELNIETKAEIERLEAKNIFILGGKNAVSETIEKKLDVDYDVVRIDGDDRYETSANIAKYLDENNKLATTHAVIAYGQKFPDALAISSWAAENGVPILLSEKESIPEATATALKDLEISETIISGGTDVISAKVEAKLPAPTRYGGNNRYETAVKILEGLDQNIDTLYVATGTDFPDALAGAALAAKEGKGILLVGNTGKNLDSKVVEFLQANTEKITSIRVLGGSNVVSAATLKHMTDTLAGIVEETPEAAVANALDALKVLNEETAQRYFDEDLFVEDYQDPNISPEALDEISKLMFANLEYKIKSSAVNGEAATVTTEITNTDMGLIMDEYMLEIMKLGLEDSSKPEDSRMTEEEFMKKAEEIMLELFRKEDNKKVTTTVDIKLTKNDHSWIITADDELQDAFSGGLVSYMNELSELEVME